MKVRSVRVIAPAVGLVLVAVTATPALGSPTAAPRMDGPGSHCRGQHLDEHQARPGSAGRRTRRSDDAG